MNARTQARHQLKSFLLRHGVRYPQRTSCTTSFYRWLATLHFDGAGAQIAFTEYRQAVSAADERAARLTDALVCSIKGWRFEPVVQALQVLRGIDQISCPKWYSTPRTLSGQIQACNKRWPVDPTQPSPDAHAKRAARREAPVDNRSQRAVDLQSARRWRGTRT